jgi:ATP-binding cassette, subfamily B, bacterial CvaB/MchF/RaxB
MKDFGLDFGFRRRLPLTLQSEAAECGLACLAMVAGYHGHPVDLPALRRRFSLSQRGITLAQLLALASRLELEGRPLRVELEHLPGLQAPCILHWDMNHFVVLKEVRRSSIVIHDPSFGVRRLSFSEASSHFTGIALELQPTARFEFKNETRRITLQDTSGRVVGLKRAAAHVFALAIVLELLAIASPFFLQWVVDGVLVNGDRNLLVTLGLGFALLVIMQSLTAAIRSWTTLYFSTTLNIQWCSNLFTHLLRLPVAFFEKRFLGDLISRFDSVHTIQQALTSNLVEAIVDGVMAFFVLTVMFIYSGTLGSVALASVIGYAALRIVTYGYCRKATVEYIAGSAKQQGFFIETLRGIQPLKMFGKEAQRKAKWLNLMAGATNAKLKADKLEILARAANIAIFGLESVLIVWVGARLVLGGSFSIGMLFAFAAYKDQFNSRTGVLIDRLFELRLLSLQAERLSDIVLEPAEPTEERPMLDFTTPTVPGLEIRSLSYRYSETDPWLLQDVNLRVSPGECVAITGRSGAGKSTVVKLISGLLPLQHGEVLLGGLSVHRNRTQTTSRIGFVMQEDSLFSGTISENIHFFDDAPDDERVIECAVVACIHDDIGAMPMGYDTMVGDMGTGLSGGQKQRILIARALYRKPSVLVLDEATSHLDLDTEKLIAQSLRALKLTQVMVAHRPQTIAAADRVLVIENGRLSEAPTMAHPIHLGGGSVWAANTGAIGTASTFTFSPPGQVAARQAPGY